MIDRLIRSSVVCLGASVRAVSNSCEHLQKEHQGKIQNRYQKQPASGLVREKQGKPC